MGDKLQTTKKAVLSTDGAQYALTLGVIAVMLYVVGIPFYIIFFLGAFSFFLFKIFTSGTRSESRLIFEFYLLAGEMLREDGRIWYGFEIRETIDRGEKLLQAMPAAPPLLHFALGALYDKSGDYESAARHLSFVFDTGTSREQTIVFPTPGLRDYVRILRKIERDPSEAPLMSASIRRLERLRKTKGMAMLDAARIKQMDAGRVADRQLETNETATHFVKFEEGVSGRLTEPPSSNNSDPARTTNGKTRPRTSVTSIKDEPSEENGAYGTDRKTISEVLQDIYDGKVQ